VIEAVRTVAPEVYAMGSHGTVKPAEILALTRATAVVRGEPENTVLELARTSALSAVNGISYVDGGTVVHRPDQKPVRMDDLPLPAFDLLPMDKYHYEVLGDRFTLFEMSRGCASNCTFCLLKTYGTGVRKKSVQALIREIEFAVREHGVRTAYFIDLEFTVLRKQVLELCRYLVEANLGLEWCCQTRLDLVDGELLSWMRRDGCRLIHTGVEAGSDRMLELVDKGITLDGIRRGIAAIKDAGIETACFFMIGFPESTEADMEDIVQLAMELEPTYPLFHVTAPYPGTRLHAQVLADPSLRFSDDSLFPEAIEARFTLPELKAMTRRAYLRYYTRPRYVMNRLRKGDFSTLVSQLRLFSSYVRA
jgi:anaerobic magnesium-protoporphyrin IX monomethyl ester cyclase